MKCTEYFKDGEKLKTFLFRKDSTEMATDLVSSDYGSYRPSKARKTI